ncbi:ankyrin repeat domain-containing protein 39-like [Haliotis rubra]|uniref:ankyrin repeat domain-containing protein 39-like n=1 Tax=Haliotis rubra TaxID=36100 RepID=UPI001EE5C162|nr:ankyrin repeat domain-containing protein 39-like [Haliotis rubra]
MAHTDHKCSGHFSAPSVHQTLDELEFERGIWSAALNGDLTDVKRQLEKDIDADKTDKSGYTALHYASRNGHLDVVRTLVDAGAHVDVTTRSGHATPLHRAAYMGHTDIVKFLLSRGADPVSRDSDEMTPLHKASERGRLECVTVLLEASPVTRTARDSRGRTPSDCAKDDTIKHLLS